MLPTFELVSQTAAGRFAFGARSVAGEYVGRLLTRAVPSLERGELEIVAIARRPGVLTKVSVHQPDAVGIGIGADHIARVREQLDREQIHVVPWRREPRRYIAAALGLSDVPPMLLKPAIQHAQVFVGEIDLRGMDGWRGINRLLASSLTGWRIRLSPIASTPGWRVLELAMAAQRPLVATVLGPSSRGWRVEVEGLFAVLAASQGRLLPKEIEAQEMEVRVVRMDADEGRIVVSDRLRRRAQLVLPLR